MRSEPKTSQFASGSQPESLRSLLAKAFGVHLRKPSEFTRESLRSSLAKAFGVGAGDETRTRDFLLGKETLYH
jgi:hypothetical protein